MEVMGGSQSKQFQEFKTLILQGLIAARKHMEKIVNLVEIMLSGKNFLICYENFENYENFILTLENLFKNCYYYLYRIATSMFP